MNFSRFLFLGLRHGGLWSSANFVLLYHVHALGSTCSEKRQAEPHRIGMHGAIHPHRTLGHVCRSSGRKFGSRFTSGSHLALGRDSCSGNYHTLDTGKISILKNRRIYILIICRSSWMHCGKKPSPFLFCSSLPNLEFWDTLPKSVNLWCPDLQ